VALRPGDALERCDVIAAEKPDVEFSAKLFGRHHGTHFAPPRLPPRGRRSQGARACAQELHHHGHATRAGAVLLPPSGAFAGQEQAVRSTRRARFPTEESAAHVASGSLPARWIVEPQIGSAAPWCRLPLPLRRSARRAPLGACRCSRGGHPSECRREARDASQHFLNDTGAGSGVG
jgi:hypothetical protein